MAVISIGCQVASCNMWQQQVQLFVAALRWRRSILGRHLLFLHLGDYLERKPKILGAQRMHQEQQTRGSFEKVQALLLLITISGISFSSLERD